MSGGLTLSPAELQELTGYTRYGAQGRALTAMGIPFRPRPNGTLAVLREGLRNRRMAAAPPAPKFKGFKAPSWWPPVWDWDPANDEAWTQRPFRGRLLPFLEQHRDIWYRSVAQLTAGARPLDNWPGDVAGSYGVYFLFRDGHLTYVGLSSRFEPRLYQHRIEHPFDAVFLLPLFERAAIEVEGYYVRALRPPENANYSRLGHALAGWKP